MKYFLSTLCFLFCAQFAQAQYDPAVQKSILQFHSTALTSWGAANVAHSLAYGIGKGSEYQNLRSMNLAWGAINMGLGALTIFEARKPVSYFTPDVIEQQQKAFLINGILDIGYIASGVITWGLANRQNGQDRRDVYRGFGKSIVMQGAVLLALDLIGYYRNK